MYLQLRFLAVPEAVWIVKKKSLGKLRNRCLGTSFCVLTYYCFYATTHFRELFAMLNSTPISNKIATFTNVEDIVLFCSLLLQDTYANTQATEGLDQNSAEVKASVATVDFVPVVLATGSKSYRAICRISLSVDKAVMYRAAKWSFVNPFGSDGANANIVGIANGT